MDFFYVAVYSFFLYLNQKVFYICLKLAITGNQYAGLFESLQVEISRLPLNLVTGEIY